MIKEGEHEVGGTSCTHGEDEKYKSLVRESEGKRPLGGPSNRYEDTIKMHNKDIY
jgi:hypothetical protein